MKFDTIQYLDRNESQYGPTPKVYEYLKDVGLEEI